MRTRPPPSALALAQLVREEVHLWRAELDATSPQFAENMRLIHPADERVQTDDLYVEHDRRTFSLLGVYS